MASNFGTLVMLWVPEKEKDKGLLRIKAKSGLDQCIILFLQISET